MSNEKIDPMQDNIEAHEAINMCLSAVGERLSTLEEYIQNNQLVQADILKTFDQRLQKLEAMAHKAPSTNHGERLTALENCILDKKVL